MWYALEIRLRAPPRDWPAWLAEVPDALRYDAEAYLRDVATLMRSWRAMGRKTRA